jgi:hypothetical protein
MKLHIKRNRNGQVGGWSLEQHGVFVGWTPCFRRACEVAGEWQRDGLMISEGW